MSSTQVDKKVVFSDEEKQLNEVAIRKRLGSFQSAVVLITASWCGFCRRMQVVIDELKKTPSAGVHIEQIDMSAVSSAFLREYDVKAFPTILRTEKGKVVKIHNSGDRSLAALKEFAKGVGGVDPVATGPKKPQSVEGGSGPSKDTVSWTMLIIGVILVLSLVAALWAFAIVPKTLSNRMDSVEIIAARRRLDEPVSRTL